MSRSASGWPNIRALSGIPFLANGSKVISATIITESSRKILTLSINMDRILIMAAIAALKIFLSGAAAMKGSFATCPGIWSYKIA